jgi:hypothetical protein
MRQPSRLIEVVGLVLVSLSGSAAFAGEVSTLDQSDVSLEQGYNVSLYASAADFIVAGGPTLVTSATIWLSDGDSSDDGTLNSFSGSLSWAIYTSSPGEPGAEIQSGLGLNVVQLDTGLQPVFGDAIQVRFDLDRPVALAPGLYWLAIHENAWRSAYDDSSVYWEAAAIVSGSVVAQSSALDPPGPWDAAIGNSNDLAFALYGSPMVWNQGGFSTADAWNISAYLPASDFTLDTQEKFSAIEAWIWTVLDGDFSGTLSWAIYTDNSGVPGTLLASGADPATRVVATGVTSFGYSIRQLQASMGTSVTLAAGTYWLALHEGTWGSAYDGSSAFWSLASSNVGYPVQIDTNPVSPGTWDFGSRDDTAFILYNDPLLASGFETDGTCAWSNAGDCP